MTWSNLEEGNLNNELHNITENESIITFSHINKALTRTALTMDFF